jgi:SAM-dependent methyltransferase
MEDRMTELDRPRSRAQALMEWKPLIDVYESRWWRKSGLFGLLTGIRFEREYEKIVGALELGGDERLLDLACGSGIYSRPLAGLLDRGHVVGLDLSAPMLRYAAREARGRGIGNLHLVRASALDLPFPDDGFDRVNCCGALHLFPDFSRAASEILRVLAPGGIFTMAVFRNWLPGRRSRKLADIRYRRMGVKNFQPGELESLVTGAGFEGFGFHHGKRYWQIASARKPG